MQKSILIFAIITFTFFASAEAHRCRLCTEIADLIEMDGSSSVTQNRDAVIESVCARSPSSYQQRCKTVANELLTNVLTRVAQGKGTKMACDQICSYDPQIRGSSDKRSSSSVPSWSCWLCDAAMALFQRYSSSGDLPQMNEQLDFLCDMLDSKEEENQCKVMSQALIHAASSGADPSKVCVSLKQCSSTDAQSKHTQPLKSLLSGDADTCDVCRVTAFLTRMEAPYSNAQMITTQLSYLCDVSGVDCEPVLSSVPLLYEKIKQGEHRVCRSTKFCDETKYLMGHHWGRYVNRDV